MKRMFYKLRDFFKKVYRILVKTVYDFVNNNDSLKASALTYYTLISIVPFLAVAFGLASGFGFAEYLERQLSELFEDQPEIIGYAIQFARSLLKNTQGSVIAGVGVVVLLWTNLSLLSNIESALNEIWHVKTSRTWTKKISDYLAAMIICPIFLVVSSSLNVYLMTQIKETAKEYALVELMSPYLLFFLRLVPTFLSILLFIVIYLFIPNTYVKPYPRIVAGVIAGIAFQIWQWIYFTFQVEISNYGVIYGTFAALPLFLLWLQVSWLILLAGAELGAHIENEMSQDFSISTDKTSKVTQRELGLLILEICVKAYMNGNSPPTALQIAQELEVPLFTTQKMLDVLQEGALLVRVISYAGHGYQPSKDARLFTIKNVCDAIDVQTEWHTTVINSANLERINECLDKFDRLIEESSANLTIDKILEIHKPLSHREQ